MDDFISCDESTNSDGLESYLKREFDSHLSDTFPSLSFDDFVSIAKALPDIDNKYTVYNYVGILRRKGIE